MKKHSKSSQRSEPSLKRAKARGPVQRDAKEVLAEVLERLRGKLDAPAVSTSAKENRRGNTVGPNRDRLTVGVDLGDRWSQYCILGLEGETLAEGQLRTTQEDVGEFFRAFTTVGSVAAPCGSPAVPHLHRYYRVVRLLQHPSVLPPVDPRLHVPLDPFPEAVLLV